MSVALSRFSRADLQGRMHRRFIINLFVCWFICLFDDPQWSFWQRERERERERERLLWLIDCFIKRMTVLGRGLVFQPVLVTQTYTYNSNNIHYRTLTLQIFHQKKKKKIKEHTNPHPTPNPPLKTKKQKTKPKKKKKATKEATILANVLTCH